MQHENHNRISIQDLFNAALPETEDQISQLHMHLNQAYDQQPVYDEQEDLTELLTEQIPVIGKVPILFYVPDCTPTACKVRRMIEQHGGVIIYIPECCCYQIYPECPDSTSSVCLEDYSKGLVFSSNWLSESIAS